MADFWETGALDAELAYRRERLSTDLARRPNCLERLGRSTRAQRADQRRARAATPAAHPTIPWLARGSGAGQPAR